MKYKFIMNPHIILICRSVGWLAGWLVVWLVGWLVFLAGWLYGLVGWLVGWLDGWLVGRSVIIREESYTSNLPIRTTFRYDE